MTQITTAGRDGVEAFAAACAGGQLDKVTALLEEGECHPVAKASRQLLIHPLFFSDTAARWTRRDIEFQGARLRAPIC
jgi:hypothetical protein